MLKTPHFALFKRGILISALFLLSSCTESKPEGQVAPEQPRHRGITGDSVSLDDFNTGLWREYSKDVEENYAAFGKNQKLYLSRSVAADKAQLISSHDEELSYTVKLAADGKTVEGLSIQYGSSGSADYVYNKEQRAFVSSNPNNHLSYRKVQNAAGISPAAVASNTGVSASSGGAAAASSSPAAVAGSGSSSPPAPAASASSTGSSSGIAAAPASAAASGSSSSSKPKELTVFMIGQWVCEAVSPIFPSTHIGAFDMTGKRVAMVPFSEFHRNKISEVTNIHQIFFTASSSSSGLINDIKFDVSSTTAATNNRIVSNLELNVFGNWYHFKLDPNSNGKILYSPDTPLLKFTDCDTDGINAF